MLKAVSTLAKAGPERYARLFKRWLEGPATTKELAEASGLAPLTVRDFLRIFRRHGLCHITGWEPDSKGRDAIGIFTFGAGTDKPRRKMTVAERQARCRALRIERFVRSDPWKELK